MRRSARQFARMGACAGLAVASLAGCGAHSAAGGPAALAHAAAVRPAGHRAAAHPPGHSPGVSSADLVAAVGGSDGNVPVAVRFALLARPQVGKPVELDVVVTPSAPVGKIVTSFYAENGLTIAAGGTAKVSERPDPGTPLSRALTIVAQRDGIFYVNATVLVDIGADSVARTFTIPIIAGAGTS